MHCTFMDVKMTIFLTVKSIVPYEKYNKWTYVSET